MSSNLQYTNLRKGMTVTVSNCEGKRHGNGVNGCVCSLIGKTVVLGEEYDNGLVGIPTFYVVGYPEEIRIREDETNSKPPPSAYPPKVR